MAISPGLMVRSITGRRHVLLRGDAAQSPSHRGMLLTEGGLADRGTEGIWRRVIRGLYAISRLRRDLEDLKIAWCVFAGEEVTNSNHVAIIANGNGVRVIIASSAG